MRNLVQIKPSSRLLQFSYNGKALAPRGVNHLNEMKVHIRVDHVCKYFAAVLIGCSIKNSWGGAWTAFSVHALPEIRPPPSRLHFNQPTRYEGVNS